MIKKVISKRTLGEFSDVRDTLNYWFAKPPEQRVEVVDYLRKQYYGSSAGLQRVIKVTKRA